MTDGYEELEKYKSAILTELMHLKSGGGRDYSVSNGQIIRSNQSGVYYSFEMESELFISDDAPITLKVDGEKATGSVFMCEGFQIIVVVNHDFGERISKAWISVEPWKLMEALHEKMDIIDPQVHHLAYDLLNIGPELSSDEPANTIPRGQKIAQERALSEGITVIWGPPGTGKTYTMAKIAIKALQQGLSVLIVSHSNISVDGATKEIVKQIKKTKTKESLAQGKILRYGYVRDDELTQNKNAVAYNYAMSKHPDLEKRVKYLTEKRNNLSKSRSITQELLEIETELKQIRTTIRDEERVYAERARIVTTTISKVTVDPLFEDKSFDVVMFDEASMAYVPQIVCAASYAEEHFVCVGDFRQLPPIAQSSAKKTLQNDIFYFLGITKGDRIHPHEWMVMLYEQRRMHPAISAFSNKYVYEGLLRDHKDMRANREDIVDAEPLYGYPMNLIDLGGTYCAAAKTSDNSRFNILSAYISFTTAVRAEVKGIKSVCIIAPYRAQTRLIRAMIQDYKEQMRIQKKGEAEDSLSSIVCATVHQFQGSERDVVVFDAVESYPFQQAGYLLKKNENRSIMRLINVAVTRARGKLVTVANTRFWKNRFEGTGHMLYKLLQHMSDRENVIGLKDKELQIFVQQLSGGNSLRNYTAYDKAVSELLADIDKAENEIIINVPDGKIKADQSKTIIQKLIRVRGKRVNNRRLIVKCKVDEDTFKELPIDWKSISWASNNVAFPIIVIDKRIVWYGLPISRGEFIDGNTKYHTVLPMIMRFAGRHTVDLLLSYCDYDRVLLDGNYSTLKERMERITDIEEKEKVTGKSEDGTSKTGLAKHIEQFARCTKCNNPMALRRGKTGKISMRCSVCGEGAFIPYEMVNQYIERNNVACPEHNTRIHAGVSKYGLYVRCVKGHFLKPDEI